jgi:hypothetical protein
MKAIARRDITEYTDIKWTANEKYNFKVDKENYMVWLIEDSGKEIGFCGELKDLEDIFNFVED